jgi:phosphoribosylamine-glycine ligase
MMLGATKGDPVEWMRDALGGKDTTSFSEDIGCCLVLATGDFPHGNLTKQEVAGIPIYGVTRGTRQHIHPQGVQLMKLPDSGKEGKGVVEREMWATSGDYVAVINGFGNSVSQATKRAYSTIEKLHLANPIVRDDIGETLKKQLPELHAMGYAAACAY